MPDVKCPECSAVVPITTDEPGESTVLHLGDGIHQGLTVHDAPVTGRRVKHNADGTHTETPVTPPKARTDPKPRGRRRA